ncbi:MAG: 1-deoxy-D-xylulose-5-phosphate synthase, partial [Planctomycetota bacterium]
AEENALKYHGVGKFDKITGKAPASKATLPSYTNVFGKTMLELAEKNQNVIAITAAMPTGTGLVEFGEKYPDRFFDVGIAEAHAACFSAALAAEGVRPYLTVYSTFMQRAYDQVIHDMAIQNLPVVICMDRAGLVGNDGPTHHGVFDIAYLSTVPNVTLCAPKDGNELRAMLHYTVDHEFDGIIALRYPRDTVPVAMSEEVARIQWGTWEQLGPASDIALLAVGSMVYPALQAAQSLTAEGIHVTVVNARFVKPLDEEMLARIRQTTRAVITIEEGSKRGGFGETVGARLLADGYTGHFRALGTPDRFVTHGNRSQLLAEVGLTPEGIAAAVKEIAVIEEPHTRGLLQRLRLRRNGLGRKHEPVTNHSPTG